MKREQYESHLARRLSELIPTLSDPRVPMIVTVERVRLSGDLSSAKVLVSALADDTSGLVEALNSARGHLQREIGRELKVKKTPTLSFHDNPLEVT